MSKNYITVDILKSILDEKIEPLKSEVVDLREKLEETNKFIEFTNAKYEEIWGTSKHNEEQKGIIAENKILKTTMKSLEGTYEGGA
jgi:predicted nuclease with TOPRIM domain